MCGMTEASTLEVTETPLAFHGGPELARARVRRIPSDDLAAVFADTAFNTDGWYPLCVLQLFGGEQIPIALPPHRSRRAAHTAALELAAHYSHYLPPDPPDDDFDDDWNMERVCARCGSVVARLTDDPLNETRASEHQPTDLKGSAS